ncbi:hypothetical protein CCMA1212_008162 [Trichoderma ghanense]|uniref:HNH nuclease domain-containing protein n=1 Tax=Trichoderma ghanense TaxID=65468 RepID=A0ABY2GWN6_9HYPO
MQMLNGHGDLQPTNPNDQHQESRNANAWAQLDGPDTSDEPLKFLTDAAFSNHRLWIIDHDVALRDIARPSSTGLRGTWLREKTPSPVVCLRCNAEADLEEPQPYIRMPNILSTPLSEFNRSQQMRIRAGLSFAWLANHEITPSTGIWAVLLPDDELLGPSSRDALTDAFRPTSLAAAIHESQWLFMSANPIPTRSPDGDLSCNDFFLLQRPESDPDTSDEPLDSSEGPLALKRAKPAEKQTVTSKYFGAGGAGGAL